MHYNLDQQRARNLEDRLAELVAQQKRQSLILTLVAVLLAGLLLARVYL